MSIGQWVARPVDALLEATVVGSFSRIGIETRRRLEGWAPVGDLTGRIVVVTGATSGIGKAAAGRFAALGARVVLVGRDEGRLGRARHDTGAAETYVADLSDLDAVRGFVRTFRAQHDELHVLVHNAGALVHEYRITPQGFENTYASQVLAQHVITSGLLPLLQAAHGRVIVVSSGGMYSQRLDPDTVEMGSDDFDGVRAYALAKRAQVTLAREWARRFGDTGVAFHSMHPGWADTPGVRTSLPTFHRVTGPFLRTAEQGADTIVWLADDAEALSHNGRFWHDRRPRSAQRLPGTEPDADTAAALWDQVCRQTQIRPGADIPAESAGRLRAPGR